MVSVQVGMATSLSPGTIEGPWYGGSMRTIAAVTAAADTGDGWKESLKHMPMSVPQVPFAIPAATQRFLVK